MKGPEMGSDAPACCHAEHSTSAKTRRSEPAKYFCPMCAEVESDEPGICPKCGMALESATPQVPPGKAIYTCPMHPEIEEDKPGNCPICGMDRELKIIRAGAPEENAELADIPRRFWIGAALTLP